MLKFTWACFDWFWTISGPVSFFRSWTRYTKLLFCDIGLLVWILSESCNENHGQWERYKRHISNVSMTPVNIISALHIELQWLRCRFLCRVLIIKNKDWVESLCRNEKFCLFPNENFMWHIRRQAIFSWFKKENTFKWPNLIFPRLSTNTTFSAKIATFILAQVGGGNRRLLVKLCNRRVQTFCQRTT